MEQNLSYSYRNTLPYREYKLAQASLGAKSKRNIIVDIAGSLLFVAFAIVLANIVL